MNSTGWRALLLGLCAIVASLGVIAIVFQNAGPNATSLVGQWGDTVGASSQPYNLLVLSVNPGHAAALAGVRPGDRIDVRANSAKERFWLFGQPPTGQPVTVLLRRGSVATKATLLPQTISKVRLALLTPIWIGFIWIALFAAIIALRRSNDPQMRALCILLIAYGFWQATNEHYIGSELLWVHVAGATINVFGTLAVAFWAACAGSFGQPRSPARRAAQALCYALMAVAVVVGLLRVVGIATLAVDPIALSSTISALPFVAAFIAATVCTVLAVAAVESSERQRALWSLVPVALLILVGFAADAVQGVIKSYELAWSTYYAAAAINFITPAVLTYVALNRRLLDIGFVLNRATVFAISSTIVIAIFIIVEWIANEWLSANHTTSAIAGMGVALLLGLSMRYLHRIVDRFVDRVLFRQRYEDEAALRRFAHEAGFITDRATLLERAIRTVETSTHADASILVLDSQAKSIDVDDPALVALRAWHKPIDLQSLPGSALQGQFAFPMVARGQLIGALVCGSKRDSDAYAPDESEALQSLADGVGNALGLLAAPPRPDGALNDTVAELRAAIKELREKR